MKLSQLKIDPEFQSKIPPLQFEEEQQLEQNIIAEGRLLNPIITWNGYILDGHTRYRILKKHGFIKFEVEEIQLANKYEALAWICKNQLGRRNLSPERKKFLLGKEYESTKLAVGGQPGNCNKVNPLLRTSRSTLQMIRRSASGMDAITSLMGRTRWRRVGPATAARICPSDARFSSV